MNRKSKTKKDSISELKSLRRKVNRFEKAAKLTNTRLNETQSMTHIGSWELDLIKNNLIWSDEIYRMFEIDPGKFGASYEAFLNAIHPEDRDAVNLAYTNSVKSKTPYSIDHRLLFPGGRIKFVHEECQTFYDGTGNAIRSVGTVQDITERKTYEQAILSASLYTRGLIEASIDPLVTISQDGKVTDVNHSTEIVTGFSRVNLIGKDFSILFTEPEKAREGYKKVLEKGVVRDYPLQIRHVSGKTTDVLYNATVYKNQNGELEGIFAAARDITEQKRNYEINESRLHLVQFSQTHSLDELLEETLNETEKLTGSLIGFYHFVEDDQKSLTLQNWSTRTKAMFCKAEGKGLHYAIDEAGVWVDCVHRRKAVIHNNYASLPNRKGMPEGHAEVIREMVVPVFRGNKISAILGVGNKPTDYTEKDVETVSQIADLAWDITDRVRAASKMRESEEKFAAAFYSSPNLIAITRFADGKIIDINEGYTRLLGYSRSESIGKTTNELSIWANPADRIFFINSLKKFGHITDFETTLRRKDGMLMTVIDSARIIELQGEKCVLSVIVDITERKLNELTIYKLNRIYKVLSETNQLIVREKNRDKLLKEICRIAVEYGGILMASISFVDKKTHKVIPTAWFGKEEGYFSSTKLSIENISEGKGPTGTAIRENRFVFSTDIETEPMMEPWREQALLRGYRSSAAFPLCEGGKPIGAFTMFASEPNFFTDNELTLMNELAMDVSYALENIQTEEIRIRTEKLMHQSEEKFSNAFWFSPVALSISSMEDMKYIEVNESFLQLTGYNASEVIGHTRDELNLWMHHEHLQDFIKILNEHGTVKNFEFAFRNKNGELKYGLRSASIITIGGTRCILSQTYDITEKKKAEEERLFHLKFMESLDMVTRTIQGTNDLNQMMNDVLETVFSIFDCDRIWLFYPCDPDASSFRVPMEITKPEYPGAKVLNVDIPMPPDMSQNLREALESADPLTYIVGTEKPVNKVSAEQFGVKSMMMVALRPKSGKPWAFGMHQCSTPRIWIEEEVKLFKEISSRISDGLSSMLFLRDLQESEERFRRLTENARDVIYRMSLPDGKYEYISPAALFVFGYSPEEFYNTASLIKQAIHPDWQKYFEEQWANLMKGEMPPTYEYQIIHKSGEARWLNQRNILVHDNDGNPIAIEGIVTDITERKCTENVILESEKRFKELANLLPQTIFESDINGVITFANETGLITFGYSLEDISKGFHMISMVSEKDKLEAIGNMQRLLNGQSPSKNEYEMVRKDGTTFPALTFNAPIIRNGKTIGLRGTLVDITQRKLVENELSKLSEAVAQSPASIVITDINGNIVYVNKTFEETTGYSFDEVINQNPRILKSGFMPKEEYAKLWDTITSGNTWHGEFQNKKKNGEVYWEDAFISPIKDKDGNTINYLAVKQDITEKKKMTEELITAKDQAEKSDKLKSEFLAQMSHEIRSPLNVTINLASLIKEDLGENISEQTAAYFEGIELASRRLIRTVDLILNISEIQVGTYSPTFEKVDLLNDILENLRKEFNAYAKHKGLEYIIQSTISESFVYCDRYSVNQILCNLIDNAIKYTKSGKVEVIVERDFKENVKVTVSDTGIGISKEFMDKMFQPFMQEDRGYSRRYEGTGLGLALVKKYCDLNEATIDVKSEKDIGSKFIVTFFKKES